MVPRGTEEFEVVVVGAGHAGCEAALACARLGLSTCLVTLARDRVAEMSCNPAVGGLGKSQIVREIDVLGGEMGRAADAAAIHFRRLNASKGPAVRARRVQCDLDKYRGYMLSTVESCSGLELVEGCASSVHVDNKGSARGVGLEDGRSINARTVVLTTGTFLRGMMHTGMESTGGGRVGDPPVRRMTGSLNRLGLKTGRLKTGTPPRLDARSIDFDELQRQPSDRDVLTFSHDGSDDRYLKERVDCHYTRTNRRTHRIVKSGLDRSPLFTGVIKGQGPRYCPSIEDKVVRFPEREGHQVVIEPMDLSGRVIYPNGISTSLPLDVQQGLVRSIRGLEKAEIVQPGYAVEYDFVHPTQLDHGLQSKDVAGLFLAGQINGTSGYEEAAGLGLLAGLNAVAYLRGSEPVVLARHEAYLGVLVDDLVTRGTSEPYRMFSSRAEFRLLLREDNAVARLRCWAERIGLVPAEVQARRNRVVEQTEELIERLCSVRAKADHRGRRPFLDKILRRPQVRIGELVHLLHLQEREYPIDVLEQAEVRIKYKSYVERQTRDAERLARQGLRRIPPDIVYQGLPGLSRELKGKLDRVRPLTFEQAGKVDGMTPAALLVLSVYLDKSVPSS